VDLVDDLRGQERAGGLAVALVSKPAATSAASSTRGLQCSAMRGKHRFWTDLTQKPGAIEERLGQRCWKEQARRGAEGTGMVWYGMVWCPPNPCQCVLSLRVVASRSVDPSSHLGQ
jgi:hypothetical protein